MNNINKQGKRIYNKNSLQSLHSRKVTKKFFINKIILSRQISVTSPNIKLL